MKEESSYEEGEITLKELLIRFGEFYTEIYSNWAIIIIATLGLGILFSIKNLKEPAMFTYKIQFKVAKGNDKIESGEPLGFIVEEGRPTPFNQKEITEIGLGNTILHQVLLDTVEIADRKDQLINVIVEKAFVTNNLQVDKVKNQEMIKRTVIKMKSWISFKETPGTLLELKVKCPHPTISILLVQKIFMHLKTKYIEIMEKPKIDLMNSLGENRRKLLFQIDSLESLSLVGSTSSDNTNQAQKIENLYHTVKNVDALWLQEQNSFKNNKPYFFLISKSLLPLMPEKKSWFRGFLFGAGLAFFNAIFFIIGRKIINDALKEP